jgi:hypothetical protein
MHSLHHLSLALEDLYSESLCSRRISRTQLRQLQFLKQNSLLSSQQNRLIKRLMHACRRGWLNIID